MKVPLKQFPNFHVLDHPLIQHKLSLMRDKSTPTILFRQLLKEIALLMGYEVTRNLPMTKQAIETPVAAMVAPVIAGKKIAVVAILRAGLGIASAISAFTATPRPSGRCSIFPNCRSLRGASSSSAIPCWPPVIPPPPRWMC
jgi:hypothetical protein